MKKRALITGISGQDGSYLAELLLEKNYEVYGLLRRNSIPEHQDSRIAHLGDDVKTVYGDILDVGSLQTAFMTALPNEVYNLASQSHVRISFDIPQFTVQVNALGVINMLEVLKGYNPSKQVRFYQASSSECFGNEHEADQSQNENTRMNPVSPYGCAKVFGYDIVRHYRRAYKLFVSNGILFNHTSPRRASNFVLAKIVKGAVMIKKGLLNRLELGNLDSARDIGHSKDYVRAMWMILNHDEPDDFVVATGRARSISHICAWVFGNLGMEYKDYVVQNGKFMRPEELRYLKGDASKIKRILGWEPEYTFETMLDEIIEFWMKKYE